jgi:hypothetical protein
MSAMKFRALAAAPLVLTASSLAVVLTACSGSSSGGSTGIGATTVATASAAGAATGSATAPTPTATAAFAGQAPSQILDLTEKAVGQATAVHVSGDMVDGKDKISLDLSVGTAKRGTATGSLTIGGDKMSIRRIGSTLYFRTGRDFWVDQGGADSSTASRLADRWIKAGKSQQDFADFFELASVKGLTTEGITITKAEIRTLKTVAGKSIDGKQTVGLFEPKSAVNDEAGTLYVDATGTDLPLEISGGRTKVDYTDWNQAFSVTAPSGALDLAKLAG